MPFGLSFLFGRKLNLRQEHEDPTQTNLKRLKGSKGHDNPFFCPSCGFPYNMGKKRKLVDACGHSRCYSCVYQDENCQFCLTSPSSQEPRSKRQNGKLHSPQHSRNAHFKTRSNSTTQSIISSKVVEEPSAQSNTNGHFLRNLPIPRMRKNPPQNLHAPSWVNARTFVPFSEESYMDEGFEEVDNSKALQLDKMGQTRKRRFVPSYWDIYSRLFNSDPCSTAASTLTEGSLEESERVFSSSYDDEEGGAGFTNMTDASMVNGGTQELTTSLLNASNETQIQMRPISTLIEKGFPPLRPLFFEVPTEEGESSLFVGRQWLFEEIRSVFSTSKSSRGVIISGVAGTGKTSIILQMVENSCFGRRGVTLMDSTPLCLGGGLKSGASREWLTLVASQVVAYHFCQVDNSRTCLVPEFIHSFAAQLCQAPQLAPFREYLLSNPSCLAHLSSENCLINPSRGLVNGILEPLDFLHRSEALIVNDFLLVLVDGLSEAEYHRTDSGDTISSFLAKHFLRFPSWLKIILTIRSTHQDTVSLIPFHQISLNKDENQKTKEDLYTYSTNMRINNCMSIRSNLLTHPNKGDQFKTYLVDVSGGSFLYLKLTLDLIQLGHVVIKSKNFKVLPTSLSELFLLYCNLRFPTASSFERIEPILTICLAALNPLNLLEIYHSVNALFTSGGGTSSLLWEEFIELFKSLSGLLVKRSDGTFMFFHSSFREWLLRREKGESKKFLCDIRKGHAAISLRLSRIEAPLGVEKTLELAHHILKANIFKNTGGSIPARDLQAIWLTNSCIDLSAALASHLNIFYPNIKVSRLLLIAGASPNTRTSLEGLGSDKPSSSLSILSVAAAKGLYDLAALLVEFGADLEAENLDGERALHLASENGHTNIAQLLVNHGATIFSTNSRGESPLVKAATRGHLEMLAFFCSLNYNEETSSDDEDLEKKKSIFNEMGLQGIVAASSAGHIEIVEFLMDKFPSPADSVDTLYGESPLSAAALHGQCSVLKFLIKNGAKVEGENNRGFRPLHQAARGGHINLGEVLLESGAEINSQGPGKATALIFAAKEGHSEFVEFLLAHGAEPSSADEDLLSALSWASLKGHLETVRVLVEWNEKEPTGIEGVGHVNVNHADHLCRTPLDLASFAGNEEIAQLLLEKGSCLEHVDLQGVRPLDRAVGCGQKGVVELFLKKGAKLGPGTWTMATGKPEIILSLLMKLLEDGKTLAGKGQLKDAAYRFQYAIRKLPLNQYSEDVGDRFEALRLSFLIQLSRVKRKMNEYESAIKIATEAVQLDPTSFKALYTRAKAYRSANATHAARADLNQARELVGNRPDMKKQLARLRGEIARERSPSVSPSC